MPSRRSGWPKTIRRTILFGLAAVGTSGIVAAWITNSDFPTLASAALPANADDATFEDRFLPGQRSDRADVAPLNRFVLASAEPGLPAAPDALSSRWLPQDFRSGITDDEPRAVGARPAAREQVTPDPVATVTDAVPLPRSRPAAADLEARSAQALAMTTANAPRPADRTLMQKLSDLMPGRFTLASLTPPGTSLLFNRGPDLAELGYDGSTAVYDISAHAVYMPNRTILEAHSGMGALRDDPEHATVPNFGATPPAIYSLKPREAEFHGVAALRMTPAEGSDINGRSGLLVHSFMLGPNGDSNGCISVKDYARFLKAFNDGEVNRIAVIPSLKNVVVASQNPT